MIWYFMSFKNDYSQRYKPLVKSEYQKLIFLFLN